MMRTAYIWYGNCATLVTCLSKVNWLSMVTPSMQTDFEHITMVLAKCIIRIAEEEFPNFATSCRVPVISASVFDGLSSRLLSR